FGEYIAQLRDPDRVEAIGRLVEDHDPARSEDRLGDRQALEVALRQGRYPPMRQAPQPEAAHGRIDLVPGPGADPREHGVGAHGVADGPAPRYSDALRHVGHAAALDVSTGLEAVDGRGTAARAGVPEQDPHQ